ncbi:MAG: hypothetical protein BAJALOKI2v1_870013 [Promethearchaeota archaeon]|nr:MAG: hypothetical protein BAJALOKI2v1_870013 [Candidatus Lokiarchaeota archaeon]
MKKRDVSVENSVSAFIEMMESPIRMHLFFYLSTFGEMSLSELSNVLNKPKSTINHHTLFLEEKGILIARERKVKNYTEKLYSLHSSLLKLLEKQKNLEEAILKGDISTKDLLVFFKSFTAYIYSVLQRFNSYFLEHPKEFIKKSSEITLSLSILEPKHYKKTIREINKIISDNSLNKKNRVPGKNSYGIFTFSLPYGKIFEDFLKKKNQ